MNTFSSISTMISSNIINYNNYDVNLNNKINLEKKFFNIIKNNIRNKHICIKMLHKKKTNHLNIINNILKNKIKKIQKNNFHNLTSLIGHNVLISSSKIMYFKNQNIIYGYSLFEKTLLTLISIKNKNNQLVFQKKIHFQKSGKYLYYWNGKIDNQDCVNTGIYNISIIAINNTESYIIQPLIYGKVEGIEKIPNSNKYTIDLGLIGKVHLEDIQQVF